MIREATVEDIPNLEQIRNNVRENILSNPALVTTQDYLHYLTVRGKGWVYEQAGQIVGFAVVDLVKSNVWALFVERGQEGNGYGKQLQKTMVDWYFEQKNLPLWLSTEAGTRAEAFYLKQGWTSLGAYGQQEVKFEMTKAAWEARK